MDINLLKIIGTSEDESVEVVKAVMAGTVMAHVPAREAKAYVDGALYKYENGKKVVEAINETLLELIRKYPSHAFDLTVLTNEVKLKLGKKEA